MLHTLIGFVVIVAPFLGVIYFENKLRAFSYIFALSALLSLCTSLVTQSFHIFSYGVVFSIHLIFVLGWLMFLFVSKKKIKHWSIKLNWYCVAVFFIGFFFLTSIHYHYSGTVDTVFGVTDVTKSSYMYPFYSDEWVAVALIGYSIENHALPFANPLFEDVPFLNLLFIFHSLLAEVFLLLGLAPLIYYVWFVIASGVFTCVLSYCILRLFKVSIFSSLIASLSLIFITNSGNLPGIWNLLPYNLSFIFLLFGVLGYLLRSYTLVYLTLLMSFVLYPPVIVFVIPILLGMVLTGCTDWKVGIPRFIFIALGITTTVLLSIFTYFDLFRLVIREKLDIGIIYYEPWHVIPIFILPFACIGLVQICRKKIYILFFPLLFGILFWVLYLFLPFVLIIEQARVVMITALLLVTVGGFGIDTFSKYIKEKYKDTLDQNVTRALKMIILMFFICMSIFHSRLSLWRKVVLIVEDFGTKYEFVPSPPVTRYLTKDDLALFKDIKKERFIAPVWKGLVIGVATGNYPLDSKTSTISNTFLTYNRFMKSDCTEKLKYAQRFKFTYVYTAPFFCSGFNFTGKSAEGLILYKLSSKQAGLK